MRLIDADKCPCSDCGINGLYNGCTKECIMFKKWLDSTAYDADEVVDELDEAKFYYDGYVINHIEAIDIVKRGGVE